MKHYYFILAFSLLSVVYAEAQELQPEVKAVRETCLTMRSAINTGDMDGLRVANLKLKECKAASFGSFRVEGSTVEPSLDGHFVFEPEFVDSLLELGKLNVYKYAQRYAKRGTVRGSSRGSKVFMKTIPLEKGSTAVYKYGGSGHMELAAVTEPGGMISLKVINRKTGEVYKNYEAEKTGQPDRVLCFELPTDSNTPLEVQITNYSKTDISCVVISN